MNTHWNCYAAEILCLIEQKLKSQDSFLVASSAWCLHASNKIQFVRYAKEINVEVYVKDGRLVAVRVSSSSLICVCFCECILYTFRFVVVNDIYETIVLFKKSGPSLPDLPYSLKLYQGNTINILVDST